MQAQKDHGCRTSNRAVRAYPPTHTPSLMPEPWYASLPNMDEDYLTYMRTEWGWPKHGDAALFEKLSLEGAQAGLSWRTILTKREAYRKAFHGFDIDRVAKMKESDVAKLLAAPSGAPADSVVRHRGKLLSVINNAQAVQRLRADARPGSEDGALDAFLWGFVGGKPRLTTAKTRAAIPTCSPEAEAMSKALKKAGFKFVGPTMCYSLMQSCGLVVDHPVGTPEHKALAALASGEASGAKRPKKKRRRR